MKALFLFLCLTVPALALGEPSYTAVLVAGDDSAPVFDHAAVAMERLLLARGTAPGDIVRLSASAEVVARDRVPAASGNGVLGAIEAMHPGPRQACFVFVTSHGAPRQGLFLAASRGFLTPAALDRALDRGCGAAPTVVIASGCYSGRFALPPMARANRIVLTAARADRPSFGCGADDDFTFYDRCVLGSMTRSFDWAEVYGAVRACVTAAERAEGFRASEPRAWFGAGVVR